jgi:hypothetical protein
VDQDSDLVVRLLGSLAWERFKGGTETFLSVIEQLFSANSDSTIQQKIRATWVGPLDDPVEEIATTLLPLLDREDLEQRLAGIFTLARLGVRFHERGRKLEDYWKQVVDRLLRCFSDQNPLIVWSTVIALVPVAKQFHPDRWVTDLVKYLRENQEIAAMLICELLETLLGDRFRLELMVLMGVYSPLSFASLRFATGVLLAEVGSEEEHREMVLSILDDLERDNDPVAQEVGRWVRVRLSRTVGDREVGSSLH